jgi:hypothetical protein
MATAETAISAGPQVPIAAATASAFEEAFFRLASEHFGVQAARAQRWRVRALAKSLAFGKTEPTVEAIRITPSPSMKFMASRRNLTINSYLHEISDTDLAEFRRLILATEADSNSSPLRLIERKSNDNHRSKTTAAVRGKIIEAHKNLGLTPPALAKRFNVCGSTIRRILDDAGLRRNSRPGRPGL